MTQPLRVKRSLFLRLLMYLSFGVFVITLVTGAFIYRYFNQTLKQQAFEANVEVLRQTRQIVELTLLEVQQTAFSLALNKDVQNAVFLPWDMTRDFQVLQKVHDLFSDRVASSTFIHSIYLYSEKAGKVVTNSGMIAMNDFWDNQIIRDFQNKLDGSVWLETKQIRYVDGTTDDVIRFISGVPISGHKYGTLVVNIKEDLLYNAVVNINSTRLGNVAILNRDGDVLSYKDKKRLYNRFDEDIAGTIQGGQEGDFIREIEGKRFFVSFLVSNFNGWKYVTLQPVEEVFKGSLLVFRATGIISAVCLLIGILIMLLISGKYYRPIRSLVRAIAEGVHPSYDAPAAVKGSRPDELSYIKRSFDHLLERNKQFQEKFRSHELILKDHFLLGLILGKRTDPGEIERQLDYFGIRLDQPHYAVMMVRAVRGERSELLSEQQKNMLSYRVRSLCEETLQRLCPAVVVDQEQRHVALLLNLSADCGPGGPLFRAKEIAADIQGALKGSLKLNATVGIGGIYDSCADIHFSYSEAQEALLYEKIAGAGSIICISDSLVDHESRRDFVALRSKIAELAAELKTGHLEKAETMVHAIIEEIQRSKPFGYQYKNFMLYQLVHAIVSVILDMNGQTEDAFGPGYNVYYEFGRLESDVQMKLWFSDILQKAVRYIRNKRDHKNTELLGQVCRYIEEHCSEPLSLQSVADQIYMNSTYLSKLFKEITGTTFSDYVSEVRLNKACAQLRETDMRIVEIAEGTGFGNKLNLIRSFKKHLGVTPSEYRHNSVIQRLEQS